MGVSVSMKIGSDDDNGITERSPQVYKRFCGEATLVFIKFLD